ncbi:ABC transporter permease [Bauldia sp.]|uniref:ABC transporter permease n=1 Tax=Bauldia sp. TaxID=2575872 RepID=UPI003BABACD6
MSDDTSGSASAERGLAGAATDVASFDDEHRSLGRQIQHFFHQFPTTIPFLILILAVVAFTLVTGGNFLNPLNLSLILAQVTLIATLGTAQTLVIITAGIDLSVGAIMVLSSIVMGKLAVDAGVPVFLAFPLGLATGLTCGLLNGLLVTVLRLPPFIVTLGTWSIFAALVTLVSRAATIRSQDLDQFAPFLKVLGQRIQFGGGYFIMYGSLLMIIIAIIIWYVLSRTAFGRHIYAIGDDPDAARLAGIQVTKTLIGVYMLAGFLCGVAGWILIGRVGAVSPLGNQTANLDAITAVVIGGTSLFGGRGSIIGTLFGALIVGIFDSGLSLTGVDPLWRMLTVGVLIIVAVAIDQWVRRISS